MLKISAERKDRNGKMKVLQKLEWIATMLAHNTKKESEHVAGKYYRHNYCTGTNPQKGHGRYNADTFCPFRKTGYVNCNKTSNNE